MMDKDALKELAELKEKEWRSIQEQRIEALESSLKSKCQELNEEKSKLTQLKEDFKYNLKLLEERDAELEKYEQTILTTRKQLSEKNSEISELKIKIDELKKVSDVEKSSIDECKKYYLNRLNQKEKEFEKYKTLKDNEINQERVEIEKCKRTLQRELQDLQFDLEKQRNELKNEFDEILRKREHEWRLQMDEFNTQLLAKDLQIKMVTNELEQVKESNLNLQSNTNETETSLKSLERKLKEKEWELKDTVALKEAKIKELELKMTQIQASSKATCEDLNRKNEESDRVIREKELCIEKLNESLLEEEKSKIYLEQQIKTLSSIQKENEKQNEKQISLLNDEIGKLKNDLNKEIELKAKVTVNKDLTVGDLKQINENLNRILINRNEEIENLKKKLNDAWTRQKELEADKAQLNSDWQRRYEYLEKIKAKDSQEFTKQLLDARDQALAQCKLLENQLDHKNNVIKALQTADPTLNLIQFDTNEFHLKEENEKLKQIIKQMREEMENIAIDKPNEKPIRQDKEKETNIIEIQFTPSPAPLPPTPLPLTPETVSPNNKTTSYNLNSNAKNNFEEDLKRQLLDSKQKNRQLQSQMDDFIMKQKLPDTLTDNTIINTHIKSLNETINQLRKEKVDLIAFCKKQQTKLIHIEKNLNEQNEQLRLRQTQLETLQYEMNSQTRRNGTEVNNLRQTIANLELELSATRREADEYHKATIEKNSEIGSLETKISELKVKLSTSGTQLNFGAQELFIQQLQDEIKRLNKLNQQLQIKARTQHHQLLREEQNLRKDNNNSKSAIGNFMMTMNGDETSDDKVPTLNEITSIKEIENLKLKLKSAAKYITHLIQEKEHLIEMSNQLRGELNRIKYENANLSLLRINRESDENYLKNQRSVSPPSNERSTGTDLSNKLQRLERKQYELTKQQLAFANRKKITKSDPVLSKNYKSSNYKDSDSLSVASNDDGTATVNSSIKSENLKEIWKIIDEHENNSLMNSLQNGGGGVSSSNSDDPLGSLIKIKAIRPIDNKKSDHFESSKPSTSKSPRFTKSSAPNTARLSDTKTSSKPKIRNYNDKT